jgi:hypothetical protein
VEDNWQNILVQLRQTNKMVEALMRSVTVVGVEGNSVVIEAPSDLLKGRIEQPSAKSCVEQSISHVIGVPASLRCVVKGTYRPRPQPALARPVPSMPVEADQAEQSTSADSSTEDGDASDAEEDPMLKEALSLGAEIKNAE